MLLSRGSPPMISAAPSCRALTRALSFLFSSVSHHNHHHNSLSNHLLLLRRLRQLPSLHFPSLSFSHTRAASTTVEQLRRIGDDVATESTSDDVDSDQQHFFGLINDDVALESDSRSFSAAEEVAVRELEELPEQWRRSRVAWLCKDLPGHKAAGVIRILNAQRKWITQEDATYITLHCMRIRENETGFRVYKWMIQQRWFRFDFALATKLADYLGKERKFAKCRELFDAIINQGRVPSESTFHILTVAYLSAPVQGCLDEACAIYNRMIQLGGYKPRLSLHNSLFKALVSKPGGVSKQYLKQAEYIYHNLVTSELEIHKDIYAGLIWLHSHQDVIDRERITALRRDMQSAGIEESQFVLVSIMRAFSKEGDVEVTESAWLKLLKAGGSLPPLAFVYRMELYSKIGEPIKSLEIFKSLKEQEIPISSYAYLKVVEVMCKASEAEVAESLVNEYIETETKPLLPAFHNLMSMYSRLSSHGRLESVFWTCQSKCRPNRSIYNIYLESLINIGKLEKAEEIFYEMHRNATVGVNGRSCNLLLGGFLASGDFVKAEKIYDIMCQKKYNIETPYLEKLEYVLSLKRKVVKRPLGMKLDKEQREILTGLLLGDAKIQSDDERRDHVIDFNFNPSSTVHSFLKKHVHERFYEWLTPSSRSAEKDDYCDDIPYRFSTIAHSYFGFFADQFWPKGGPVVPKLIHRWLSPRVLAYWYMYGGFKLSSGDIVLRVNGANFDDIERLAKNFQEKSLSCKVKRKGKVFWIGFQGANAEWFWKLVEPYVLENVKDSLSPHCEAKNMGVGDGGLSDMNTDSDEQSSI